MSSSLDKGHDAVTIKQLYDRDYNLWLAQMAIALKNKNTEAMDWENLIEKSVKRLKATKTFDLSNCKSISLEQILQDDFFG